MPEECHVCGKEAVSEAMVEGAKVHLCNSCLRFGRPIRESRDNRAVSSSSQQKPEENRKDRETVLNYGALIKNAREKLYLSTHELASKIFISEHELIRIEKEELKPSEKVAGKLEHALKIKLIKEESVQVDGKKETEPKKRKDEGMTLADFAFLNSKR